MPRLLALLVLAVSVLAQDGDEPQLPRDIAAAHPEGKWRIRKADLYRYLVRYWSGSPQARIVLPEYLKRRLIEDEARRRKVTVSRDDVNAWLKKLDARVRRETGRSLKEMASSKSMREAELRRRARQWLLQEGVARAVFAEKDPQRKPDAPISEDSVILVTDTLFQKAPKELDSAKLKDGVVARIRDVEITEYEYGRELSYQLPGTEVARALRDLILVEETKLLVGDDREPTKEELDAQKEWYLTFERNRIRRLSNAPREITDDMVDQVLRRQRGLTLEDVLENPGFRAQARARGHFQRAQTEEKLREYFEEHRAKYGDKVKVARILVGARGQEIPGVGRKIRTLEQGRALADAIWVRATSGEDFFELARKNTEDPDAIRKNDGIVPFWIHAATPGYTETFEMAMRLEPGGISKPFFSRGRGYVILKLLEVEKGPAFEEQREKVRKDAAGEEYEFWRRAVTRAAIKNLSLG